MPATTNESVSDGPAFVADATPVSTKMPVPMIAPMPIAVSAHGPSDRLRACSLCSSPPSARIRERGLTRSNSCMLRTEIHPRRPTPWFFAAAVPPYGLPNERNGQGVPVRKSPVGGKRALHHEEKRRDRSEQKYREATQPDGQ